MPEQNETKPAGGIEFYGGYQVYDENGIDLTLLRRNLTLPPENRLENNAHAAAFAQELWRAGKRLHRTPSRAEENSPVFNAQPILRQLEGHHVEYVLIGGLAMVAHGSAHITMDLEVCYRQTPDNLRAVAAAFAALHPYLRGAPPGLPFRFDALTIQAGLNFTVGTDLGPVHLLGEVSGVGGYNEALAQSEEAELFGLKVRVLSIDGLIAAKKAAGRLKDRNHLLELEALKKPRDAGPQGA